MTCEVGEDVYSSDDTRHESRVINAAGARAQVPRGLVLSLLDKLRAGNSTQLSDTTAETATFEIHHQHVTTTRHQESGFCSI